MDLQAYPRTVYDLFSADKKYIVPRFQREYSWGQEELIEFWNDIVGSLNYSNSNITGSHYFLGSIVLIGQETSKEFQIVDGQQRLTTITIILSVLVELLKSESSDDALGLYKFIEGLDISNKKFFKLVNENPKPFLQLSIQNYEKKSKKPTTSEESTLYSAYRFFMDMLKPENLDDMLNRNLGENVSNIPILEKLQAIRDQVLAFKVISIYVPDQDYAYDIFETLNARGMDLSTIDLVKNEIFREITNEHPVDEVKIKWDSLRKKLSSRDEKLKIDTFFRHFWISKYEFRTESKIFKSFKNKTRTHEINHINFLDELFVEANSYLLISNPLSDDWNPSLEEQEIYKSLKALELFRVTQPRSLLLSLFRQHEEKNISKKLLLHFLRTLENFHFVFTSICSSSASGLESKYSSFGRDIRKAKKAHIPLLLKNLQVELDGKVPQEDIFLKHFVELSYSNKNTRDKKLIQYIFSKIEKSLRPTTELEMSKITLEHIAPQKIAKEYVSKIGNLLPLSASLNEKADVKLLKDKVNIYKESDLKIVQHFIKEFKRGKESWNQQEVEQRGIKMAKDAYQIWKIV